MNQKIFCVYIAGPMSGIPMWNRAAFAEAECALRRIGYEVFNPAAPGSKYPDYNTGDPKPVHLRRDIIELVNCDCVAVLPGYLSRGSFAAVEIDIARGLELPVFHLRERFCSRNPGTEGRDF